MKNNRPRIAQFHRSACYVLAWSGEMYQGVR
jgi:hypothetical protein